MEKEDRKIWRLSCLCLTVLLCAMTGCSSRETDAAETGNQERTETETTADQEADQSETMEADSMKVMIGDTVFTAELADNSSAQALAELLAEGPLVIDMHDYAKMEKVGPIGQSLPENNEQITTGPGDIILYQGDSLVIYYDTNSWNFTRIGKIHDVTQKELLEAMGNGNVTVTFELENSGR